MATIVTRAAKGSPVSHTEVDSNFIGLNADVAGLQTQVNNRPTLSGVGATGNWPIGATNLTAGQVGAAMAGMGAGSSIGSYIFGSVGGTGVPTPGAVVMGTHYSGSNIRPAGFIGGAWPLPVDSTSAPWVLAGNTSLTGTWRAMGSVEGHATGTTSSRITLLLRVA